MQKSPTIAYFITPHGFGHATRSAAVMEALLERNPGTRFELFTQCPREIFKQSIGDHFGYHAFDTDIGMVQISPLEEDLCATCERLDRLFPYTPGLIDRLAGHLTRLKCQLVICDIAPLGIEAALAAGLPSLLIENFTWDWIYQGYLSEEERFAPHITYLAGLFEKADHHIQTPPVCRPAARATRVAPISRSPRSGRNKTRERLGIPRQAHMVLVSMGGVPDGFKFLDDLPQDLDIYLVIPGSNDMHAPSDKVILLPKHSNFFHPDLMTAADAMVGKAGYSTVAEAYHNGIPFAYIQRPRSPESAVLEAFIKEQMPSMAIPASEYDTGRWISRLPELLKISRGHTRTENGAHNVADYIYEILPPSGT